MEYIDFIVCAYAVNEKYFEFAEKLEKLLEKLNVDYDIDRYETFGDFKDIQLFKPTFVKEKMEKHKRNIMYVDVDTVFIDKPEISNFTFDIGVVERINEYGRQMKSGLEHGNFLTLGTRNPKSVSLLDSGKYKCDWKDYSNRRDHKRLQQCQKAMNFNKLVLNSYLKNCVIGYTERGEKERNIYERKS